MAAATGQLLDRLAYAAVLVEHADEMIAQLPDDAAEWPISSLRSFAEAFGYHDPNLRALTDIDPAELAKDLLAVEYVEQWREARRLHVVARVQVQLIKELEEEQA